MTTTTRDAGDGKEQATADRSRRGAPRKGNDEVLVDLLMLGWTHEQVADHLQISVRTVGRRRREPAVARMIRQRRADLVSETAGHFAGMARDATMVLAEQLKSDQPGVQLAASKAVLDRLMRFFDAAAQQEAVERRELQEYHSIPVTPDSWPGWDPDWAQPQPASIDPWKAAEAAIEEGRWTWQHVWELEGKDQLDALRGVIAERALAVRVEWEEEDTFTIDSPFDAAVAIVSFRPEEPLPIVEDNGVHRQLRDYIDQGTGLLTGAHATSEAFATGIVSACIKLALGTPDGLELRRKVWQSDDEAEHEDCDGESSDAFE